jgi:FtsZ-binding cell division protein ZapB
MTDGVIERLAQLEEAVRRAVEALVRIREENDQLKREVRRLGEERRQVLTQIDGILRDIAKLDLGSPSGPAPA